MGLKKMGILLFNMFIGIWLLLIVYLLLAGSWLVILVSLLSPLLLILTSVLGLQSFEALNFILSLTIAMGSFYLLTYFSNLSKTIQAGVRAYLALVFGSMVI